LELCQQMAVFTTRDGDVEVECDRDFVLIVIVFVPGWLSRICIRHGNPKCCTDRRSDDLFGWPPRYLLPR
jgi:hypothetical protein